MSIWAICPNCGSQNEAHVGSCRSCGADLFVHAPANDDVRRVVTVLFSDVTGSTVLGEQLDPESLRRLMVRYFQEMQAVVRRHRGTTEKFVGDAVMAVFGVPRLHEDDALRAVRAAVEMREALHELNDEFERVWGVRILAHTGVNTGEVIVGDPTRGESFVVGDPVNVAARLEQTAEPGQILIGESTYRLVRDAVTVDPLPPLAVKGKTEPVSAWTLLEVTPGVPGWGRRLDSPLVGRDRELRALEEAFRRTVMSRNCELVTVLGAAGVGKSRLANEFLARRGGGPRVVSGRCLPYGEGITFWPIVEVLRDAAGVSDADSPEEARSKLLELLEPATNTQLIGERLAALLGLSGVTPGIQETFWAVRKFLEELAARRPLVVVFDDIQWGEPTFLDLLEYLADWIQGVPVLLLCLARGDLLDVRGAWMAGKPNTSLIMLHPLTEPEVESLIGNLLGDPQPLSPGLAQLAEAAEGNPLFAEEMLRMLVDDGRLQRHDGTWNVTEDMSTLDIPPTIHALLTARLDRLDQEERAVIERASVVGRQFSWRAVAELSPDDQRGRLGGRLQSLIRKEFIRPDRSDPSEEDTFRFAHILIRDSAYRGISKTVRANLHERFADWVVENFRNRAGEYEEMVGYHLERAYRTLSELGPANQRTKFLAQRAVVQLASAGRRAFARGDMSAAVNLLSRATSLPPERDPKRLELLPQLAFALLETGDLTRLQAVVAETSDVARASGDLGLEARALILRLWIRPLTNPEGWAEEAEKEAALAIDAFKEVGDERGLAKGWSLLGLVHLMKAQFRSAEVAWEKSAAHAHRAGDHRDELENLSWVPFTVWAGPTHAEQGLRRCQEVMKRVEGDKKAMSSAFMAQALFVAGLGRFDEARQLITRARSLLQEVALTVWMAGPLAQSAGWIELLAGDPAAAERELRSGHEALSKIGEMAWLSTVVALLAESVYAQGRYGEAENLAAVSEETSGAEDMYSQVVWRSVRAKVLAQRGRADEAEREVRESVDLAEVTDFLHLRWHALMSYGEVLHLIGRAQKARSVLERAIQVAEQKGNLVGAQRARNFLER
jgi:class 3 adenylate cyclase/tetratricopeptide (TPR) repeat protein